jgi:hypothetical protein
MNPTFMNLTSLQPESVTVRLGSDPSTDARVRAVVLQVELERKPGGRAAINELIVAVERLRAERSHIRRRDGGLRADHDPASAEVTPELRPKPLARDGVRRAGQNPHYHQNAESWIQSRKPPNDS